MELISETGMINLLYNAKEVNIVTENSAELEILLNGRPLPLEYFGNDITDNNILHVTEPGLYNVINSNMSSTHLIEIIVRGESFQIFTFTFG